MEVDDMWDDEEDLAPFIEQPAPQKAAMPGVPLPEPDMKVVIGDQAIKICSVGAIKTYAAAVTAAKDAEIAGLRDVLQFIAGHDLDGADDRARAIICGLFIIKAKKALAARAALGDKTP